MIKIVCILSIVALVSTQKLFKSDFYDIGDNHERIRKVFGQCSTLSVLLKGFKQPEGVINWLEGIFGTGNVSFVVFNVVNISDYLSLLEQCKLFHSDASVKIAYHERAIKKTYNYDMNSNGDSTQKERKVRERMAEYFDLWRTFKDQGYILFVTFETLEDLVGCLCHRYGTFLFIIDSPVTDTNYQKTLNNIFLNAWLTFGNFQIYVLVNQKLFAYNPYKRIGNSYGAIKLFGELYTDDDVKHINGYELKVEIFWSAYSLLFGKSLNSFKGPDIDVTRMIAYRLNATVNLVKNNGKFGVKLPNGSFTGALGNLQRRHSDLVTTAFFMKDYETRSSEFTYPLYMDKLCVVVKKAPRVPPELLPLVIFEDSLWLIIFCAGMFISVVWSLLRSVNNRIRRPSLKFFVDIYNLSPYLAHQSACRQHAQIFIDTWMLFLSIPMRRLTRAQYERFFIASVSIVSMILVSIYQSGLATVFVRPIYFRDIDSLEQLDNSGNEILVKYAGFLLDVFPNDSSSTIYRNLRNKMKLAETNETAMDLVKNGKNKATITRQSTTELENYVYFAEKELFLIDKECPKEYFLAYMVPARSAYLKRLNEIMMDIHRFGFILKWIDDFTYEAKISHMKNSGGDESTLKVLTTSDLSFPFLTLMAGNILALLALAGERLYKVCRRKIS